MKGIILFITIIVFLVVLWPRYTPPRILRAIVSETERRHILRKATREFKTSTVAKNRKIDKSVRDSETAWLDLDDPIIARVVRRLLAYTDRPFQNCEKLQVVRYTPGGYYKPHQDAFSDEKNKRLVTFIIGLTDDFEGGATHFPNLDKRFRLRAGDALQFACLNNYNMISRYGLHAGESVTRGTKIIANLWVRKYAYASSSSSRT